MPSGYENLEEAGGGEPKVEMAESKLEGDVWCNTFLTIVRMRDKEDPSKLGGHGTNCRVVFLFMLFSFILYVCNGVLQFGLTYYIETGIVQFESKKFQPPKLDKSKALTAMRAAAVNGTSIVGKGENQFKEKKALKLVKICDDQQAKGRTVVYFMVLFLWFSRAMEELFASIHFFIQVCRIPSRQSKDEHMEKDHNITTLDGCSRIIGCLFVALPKAGVALYLTWVGGLLLLLQKDVIHVVFKCVCIQLIINIDSMLMKGIATSSAIDRLKKTKIVYTKYRTHNWDLYVGGYVKFTVTLILAIVFYYYGCDEITEFRKTCYDFSKTSGYDDLVKALKK